MNSLQESGSWRGCAWKRAVTQWLGGEEKLFVRRLQTRRSFTQQSLGHRGEESPRHSGTTAHLRAAKRRRGAGQHFNAGRRKSATDSYRRGSQREAAENSPDPPGAGLERAREEDEAQQEKAREGLPGTTFKIKAARWQDSSSDFKCEIKKHPSCRAPV